MTTDRKKDFLITVLFWLAIAVGIYVLLKYLLVWLLPFVIGFVIAVALQRPVDFFTKKTGLPRSVWAIGLVVLTLSALLGLLCFLSYRVYVELWGFVAEVPSMIPSISEIFDGVSESIENALQSLPDNIRKSVAGSAADLPGGMLTSAVGWLTDLLTRIANVIVTSAPFMIVTIIATVVSCCFITKDYYTITSFIRRQLSERHWDILVRAKDLFVKNILKMLRGYMLLMLLTFCELALGLTILRVEHSIAVALLIAVVDILPILGTGTVLIPWAVFCFITGDFVLGVGIAVMYVIITVIRNFAEPKVIGMQVGLLPVVTLFAMYVGLQFFGLLGVFVFPVMLIIIKSLQDSGHVKLWK